MADLIITSPSNPRLKGLARPAPPPDPRGDGPDPHRGLRGARASPSTPGVRPGTVYDCPELMLDAGGAARRRRPACARPACDTRPGRRRGALREGRPTARGPTASSRSSPQSVSHLRRPRRRARPRSPCSARASRSPATSAPCCAPPTPPGSRPSSRPTRSPTGATPTSCARARAPSSPCPVASDARPPTRSTGSPPTASRLVATTPDTDLTHTDVDYTGPVAIAVGAREVRARPTRCSTPRHTGCGSPWWARRTRSTSPPRPRS